MKSPRVHIDESWRSNIHGFQNNREDGRQSSSTFSIPIISVYEPHTIWGGVERNHGVVGGGGMGSNTMWSWMRQLE
jgi:hypothetical protein